LADGAAKTGGELLKWDAYGARNGGFDGLADLRIDFNAFGTGAKKAKLGLMGLFFLRRNCFP